MTRFDDIDTRIVLALIAAGTEVRNVRGVAAEVGRSIPVTHRRLVRLRDAGLIDWEDGRQNTLRAVVAPVPFGGA